MYCGNQMIDAAPLERVCEPSIIRCLFCDTDFPEMLTVETIFYQRKVKICRTCNDELHTCAFCGEKVLKTEAQVRGDNGEYYHQDCV